MKSALGLLRSMTDIKSGADERQSYYLFHFGVQFKKNWYLKLGSFDKTSYGENLKNMI